MQDVSWLDRVYLIGVGYLLAYSDDHHWSLAHELEAAGIYLGAWALIWVTLELFKEFRT